MALRAVPDHPKFAQLKAALGQPKGATLGWLESIWHFTGRFTPQGNIGKYSDEAIEAWVEWRGEPGALIKGLVDSGWIDPNKTHRLLVHDWHQHADKATKQALTRAGLKFCVPTVDTCVPTVHTGRTQNAVLSALPVPVPVPVPEPEPEAKTTTSPIGSCEKKAGPVRINAKISGLGIEFDEVWPRFWIRTGKGAAKSAWVKARKKASRETIEAAIVLQGPGILALAKQRGATPVYPSTWLNQERWEDDVGGLAVVESPKYSGNQQQVMAMFDERMALNLNAQQRH